MNSRWIGLALLGVVVLGSLLYTAVGGADWLRRDTPSSRDPVALTIYYGGEKSAFLANPEVRKTLRAYRIDLDARKAGSVEMATTLPSEGIDCLWPSNEVAVALARQAGKPVRGDRNIFNSPIVFYAWAEVAEALAKADVVRTRADGFLAADVEKLAGLIEGQARWRDDLGVNVFGPVKVFSTDPTRSNSGNIWSALLATAFNGSQTPTEADLPALLPRLQRYFRRMGYMEDSSGDIFENFLKQGVGSRPIIVGYENQLVEFLIENAAYAGLINEKIRVIYPEPTIFASHPLISLTKRCDRLAEALEDPAAQATAWSGHGFRSGLIGVENDPGDIAAARLPASVSLVAPMPSAAVMGAVIDSVR